MPQPLALVVVPVEELCQLIEQAVDRAMVARLTTHLVPDSNREPEPAPPLRMSRKQAAAYLGVAVTSLASDVTRPSLRVPFIRLGRRAIYERAALDAWLAAKRGR